MLKLTCVYINAGFEKIMQQEWLNYKLNLYSVITWKLLFDGGKDDTFDKRGSKFIKGDFSGEGNK